MTNRDGYRPKQARSRKLEGRPGDRRHGAGETAERERGRQDAEGSGWKENSRGPGRVMVPPLMRPEMPRQEKGPAISGHTKEADESY